MVGVVAAAGICVVSAMQPATADSQASGHWMAVNTPLRKPQPTAPPTTVDPTKDGVIAKSWKKVEGRFSGTRKPKKQGPKPQQVNDPAKPYDPRTLIRVTKRGDVRLNIGICGERELDGTVLGPGRCQPVEPGRPEPTEPRPTGTVQPPQPGDVTWEQVLSESKEVAFPGLRVKVQPAGRTLVNLDTIVYTDPNNMTTATVALLGFVVVVEATPVSYTWDFGDGAKVTTTSPGKPYPAKEITHKYMKRGAVGVGLTTNYAARFNVAGTGWQYVDGTVPIAGPVTQLQVREAVPVLVESPR